MKRLLSICDWLPPDFGAVGQYAEIEARRLAAEGAEVTLVGLSSSTDETKDERLGEGSLRTVRVLASPYERANFRQRAIWRLTEDWLTPSFSAAAVRLPVSAAKWKVLSLSQSIMTPGLEARARRPCPMQYCIAPRGGR